MKTTSTGIRILDRSENGIPINLKCILDVICNGKLFEWAILSFYGIGHLDGKSIPTFEEEIYKSERGMRISWTELNLLSQKLTQIFEIIIIGFLNENAIGKYSNDQKMYETCDIVIEMFDNSFWEVFSKDINLIQNLSKKFNEVLFLPPDFQEKGI